MEIKIFLVLKYSIINGNIDCGNSEDDSFRNVSEPILWAWERVDNRESHVTMAYDECVDIPGHIVEQFGYLLLPTWKPPATVSKCLVDSLYSSKFKGFALSSDLKCLKGFKHRKTNQLQMYKGRKDITRE